MEKDYKGLYERAVERAKQKLTDAKVDEIFPELRAQESENTRKELLDIVKDLDLPLVQKERITQWLERQHIEVEDYRIRDTYEYLDEFVGKFGRYPKDADEISACIDYVIKRREDMCQIMSQDKLWHGNAERCKNGTILYHSTYDNSWNLGSASTSNWNVIDKWASLRGILGISNLPDCDEDTKEMIDAVIQYVKHSPFSTIGKGGKLKVIAWLEGIKDNM